MRKAMAGSARVGTLGWVATEEASLGNSCLNDKWNSSFKWEEKASR